MHDSKNIVVICSLSSLQHYISLAPPSATRSGRYTLSLEQMDVLNHTWDHNKLEITQRCAWHVDLFINGIPQIQDVPDLANLRMLSEPQPVDAMIRLVDEFVVPRGLWDKFLGVLDEVGLENVREEFFDRVLKGEV